MYFYVSANSISIFSSTSRARKRSSGDWGFLDSRVGPHPSPLKPPATPYHLYLRSLLSHVLGLEPLELRRLLRALQPHLGLFGQSEEELRVPAPDHLRFLTFLQLLERVLPDRLQQPVAHPTVLSRLRHYKEQICPTAGRRPRT